MLVLDGGEWLVSCSATLPCEKRLHVLQSTHAGKEKIPTHARN
jgi:hypothetical protein